MGWLVSSVVFSSSFLSWTLYVVPTGEIEAEEGRTALFHLGIPFVFAKWSSQRMQWTGLNLQLTNYATSGILFFFG